MDLLSKLKRRILMMVARGTVKAIKSDKGMQKAQVALLADELAELEYIEPYGFTSVADAGAESVALFLGGNRDHGVILSIADRRYRLKTLAAGDVAMYHKDGTKIVLTGSGKVQIHNPAGNELIDLISQTLQAIVDARTMTQMGPKPFENVADFAALKTKVDTFKV